MDSYNILLSVRGSHVEDGEEDTLELLTEGRLIKEDEKYTIEYDESELSGMENTSTRVTVDGDRVHLQRTGMLQSEFVFTKSQRYEAVYDTPFGSMQMAVTPTQIKSDVSSEKGRIDLEYVVQVGEQSMLNRLNIDYRLKS